MNAMVDKVLAKRCEQIAGKDDRKFEVNPLDLSNGSDIVVGGGFHLYQFRSWSWWGFLSLLGWKTQGGITIIR